jgi:DNA-binding beta-propeller fold protein YncE
MRQEITYIEKLLLVLAIVGIGFGCHAQDSIPIDTDLADLIVPNRIQWIDQIPRLEEDKKASKKGWFKRLIFGKKEKQTLQKPVKSIPLSYKNTLILDQGNGTLFIANDDEYETPKFIKKQDLYFSSLVGACLLPDNTILFTDSKQNKIYAFSEIHKTLDEFGKNVEVAQPTGIAYNGTNKQVWIVETREHRISIFDQQGNFIKSIGERGKENGQFNYPTSIWIDSLGLVYIVDALNYRIQIFDSEGNFISKFGENGNGTGYFSRPKGIATDSEGNIYVVDALFHNVQIFDAEGNYLYRFGEQGRGTEEFWMPSGIYIDKQDHIYVADSYNSRVQIFQFNNTQ